MERALIQVDKLGLLLSDRVQRTRSRWTNAERRAYERAVRELRKTK